MNGLQGRKLQPASIKSPVTTIDEIPAFERQYIGEKMHRYFLLITLLFGTLGWDSCKEETPPMEEEIKAEFEQYIADRQDCEEPDDCVLVWPGCPLGCYVAVADSRADEVQKKAEELIKEYEKGAYSCIYSCLTPPTLICPEGRCEMGPHEEDAGI